MGNANDLVKSPSDTTIYAPALNKRTGGKQGGNIMNVADKIANFVEEIRISGSNDAVVTTPQRREAMMTEAECDQYEDAQKKVEWTIVEAEKFKEIIAEPPGENRLPFSHTSELPFAGNGELGGRQVMHGLNPQVHVPLVSTVQTVVGNNGNLTDDDFFHLTCHVDQSLIVKIKKGEFVDLERLLPKDKRRKGSGNGSDNRLEWIHLDGDTFLAPVSDRMNKITGFRHWEQAFRIYSTIYCGANPNRAREIWQYVSVINTVASSFMWDNVYEYDVIFRHLMEFNPTCSWAVTYSQMWNICMRDPIQQRSNQYSYNSGGRGGSGNSAGASPSTSNSGIRKKKDYCWNWNKEVPCKYGKKCHFIEQCSFCDSNAHGVNQCPKVVEKKEKDSNAI